MRCERTAKTGSGWSCYLGAVAFGVWLLLLPASAPAADLTGNGSASVSSGDSYNSVYGRRSSTGDAVASGSIVRVTGGAVSGNLYGGQASSDTGSAEADSNSVFVSGGLEGFDGSVYGGRAGSSVGSVEADGNSVIFDGTFNLGTNVQIFGGYARMSGGVGTVEALGNTVTVSGSYGLNFLVGGEAYAESSTGAAALAADNVVNLKSGSASLIYGGYAVAEGDASAEDNTVTVSGGTFDYIVGGEVHSYEGTAAARGNRVIITGGTGTSDIVGASVQSDTVSAVATENMVSVFGASVPGNVSGAFAPDSSVAAAMTRNTVIVGRGATVSGDAVGGAVTGSSPGSSADFNIVTVVDGGRVDGDVMGGLVTAENSSAAGNTVLVRNASVGGSIYGGDGGVGSRVGGNTVIIGTGAGLASTTSLYGGYVGGAPVQAAGSGNTLFVDSWQGAAARVAGFENLHFVLPIPGAPVNVPMLMVTGARQGDFSGTTVTAQLPDIITGGRAYLGDTFTLVSDASGAIGEASAGRLVSLLQGYATYFDGVLSNTGTAVQLQLAEMRMNPRIAALTEARAASAGLLNQGADLAGNTVARHSRDAAEADGKTWRPFMAVYGGRSRYHTGSHVDAEGFSGMTGVTGSLAFPDGRTLLGGFFEFGRAHLSTFNGFASGNVHGQGSSQYVGAGLLIRLDADSGPLAGWYAEGLGRVGSIDTEWYSGDLRDNMNRPAEYDLSNPYYGVQAGVGYMASLTDSVRADMYGRFSWTRQDGDSADMNGEKVSFDEVDSRRLRMGIRFDWTSFRGMTPYVDAAWEHEYDGTAQAVARDFSIPDASLRGDSGVFQIGLNMEPSDVPLMLDIAVAGSVGERDSLGGHMNVLYRF